MIAGYGEEEIFPAVCPIEVDGIVNNKLKYMFGLSDKMIERQKSSAGVMAFAQDEMVTLFMEGINPKLKEFEIDQLSKVFKQYSNTVIDCLGLTTDEEKSAAKIKLDEAAEELVSNYIKNSDQFRKKEYVDPVTSAVSILPKDELALMAEALVSLTSLKRKVSMESETVGGPIDVAIISKGDGFIWIKRKHYFKPELNPHYFENYYIK